MADDYPVVTAPVSARRAESALLCAVGSEVQLVDINYKQPFTARLLFIPRIDTFSPIGVQNKRTDWSDGHRLYERTDTANRHGTENAVVSFLNATLSVKSVSLAFLMYSSCHLFGVEKFHFSPAVEPSGVKWK